jgi:hypothetical protein
MERVIPAAGDLCFGFRANAAGPAIIGATGAAFFMRSIAHSRQFLLDVERSILSSGLHTEDVRNQIFILQFSILNLQFKCYLIGVHSQNYQNFP